MLFSPFGFYFIIIFQGAEYAVAELANFVNNGVAEFHKLARVTQSLKKENGDLIKKVAAAEAKAKAKE